MNPTFPIVFISPNRSTAKVAAALSEQLEARGSCPTLYDLAEMDTAAVHDTISTASGHCLCVGSPVYRDGAVPPVMDFIHTLPEASGTWAAPFVTWGTACSGVALWQMAGALEKKGYRIAGAAKVAAVHSMVWHNTPPGEGLPGPADLALVKELADTLHDGMLSGRLAPLARERLDYQPDAMAAEFKAKINQPWKTIPKTVNEEACTSCGTCVDECPVKAISLDASPRFGEGCFDCFRCVRCCPEGAIEPGVPLSKIEAMLRKRIATIKEAPPTRLYLGEPG